METAETLMREMAQAEKTADRIAAVEADVAKMREHVELLPRLVSLVEKQYETLAEIVGLFQLLRQLVEKIGERR